MNLTISVLVNVLFTSVILASTCSLQLLYGNYFPGGLSVPFGANGFAIGRYDRPNDDNERVLRSIQVGYGMGKTRFVVHLNRKKTGSRKAAPSTGVRSELTVPGCDLLARNTAFALNGTGKGLLLWCRKSNSSETFLYSLRLQKNEVQHLKLSGPEIPTGRQLISPEISGSGKKVAVYAGNRVTFFSTDPYEELFSLELLDETGPQIIESLQFDQSENVAAIKTHRSDEVSAKSIYLVSLTSKSTRLVKMELGSHRLGVYGFYREREGGSGFLVDVGQGKVRQFSSVGTVEGVLYQKPGSVLMDDGRAYHLYARTDSDFFYAAESLDPQHVTLRPLSLSFRWGRDAQLVFPKDEVLVDILLNQSFFLTLKSSKGDGPLDTLQIRRSGEYDHPVAVISANDSEFVPSWTSENEFLLRGVRFLGERTVLLCPREGSCVISTFSDALGEH